MTPQITDDTGHHLLHEEGTGRLICDCGWRSISASPGNQTVEATNHHREVCEQLVADNVWWRLLLRNDKALIATVLVALSVLVLLIALVVMA